MATSEDITQIQITSVSASWGGSSIGLVASTDTSGLTEVTRDITAGKYGGDIVLDKIVLGVQGTLVTVLEQVDEEIQQLLAPWWTSGPIPLAPPRYYSKYDNADVLLLHPDVMAADTTHDQVYSKAHPSLVIPSFNREQNQLNLSVTWDVFIDRANLATTSSPGYWGGTPA